MVQPQKEVAIRHEKTAADLIVEAMKHARALSLTITEAHRRGIPIDVVVERLPIGDRGELVSVLVHPTRLPSQDRKFVGPD